VGGVKGYTVSDSRVYQSRQSDVRQSFGFQKLESSQQSSYPGRLVNVLMKPESQL